MARLAAVLSSYLFFLVSCSGTAFLVREPLKQLGGQYMARGETPDPRVVVVVFIPDPENPGTPQIRQFNLGYLAGFKKAYPQHSFLLPPGDGRFKGRAAGFFISYKVKSLGPGTVEVETEASYDTMFASSLIARYEATARDIKPIYTNTSLPVAPLIVGFSVALVLAIIGAVMKLILRAGSSQTIETLKEGR